MPRRIDALLVYGNPYYNVRPHYPYGLDCLATYLRAHGRSARIEFPFLYGQELEDVVASWRERLAPRVVGVNIRNIDPYIPDDPLGDPYGPDVTSRWFLPAVRRLVRAIREAFPGTPVVLGGSGYSMSPEAISRFLGCPAGVVGAGEAELLGFVEGAEDIADGRAYESVFGIRHGGAEVAELVDYDPRFRYSYSLLGIPMRTKIGCNRVCSYCTDPLIDGRRIRELDAPIVEMLASIRERFPRVESVFFTDSELNLPLAWIERIAATLAESDVASGFSFVTQVLPSPFRPETGEMLQAAGFSRLLITVDGLSDDVHRSNRKSYRTKDVYRMLEICQDRGIAPVLQNVFGLPGETMETLDDTLFALEAIRRDFPRTTIEYTVCGRVYPGTLLEEYARREPHNVYGEPSDGLIKPLFYSAACSPLELSARIGDRLGNQIPENAVEREAVAAWRVALAYAVDAEEWHEAARLAAAPPAVTLTPHLESWIFESVAYFLQEASTWAVERFRGASGRSARAAEAQS